MDKKVIYEVRVVLTDSTQRKEYNSGNSSLSSEIQSETIQQSNTNMGSGTKSGTNDIIDKYNNSASSKVVGMYMAIREMTGMYTTIRDLYSTQKASQLYISGDTLSIKNMQRKINVQDSIVQHLDSALTPVISGSIGKSVGETFGLGKFGAVIGTTLGIFSLFKNMISTITNYKTSINLYNAQMVQDAYLKNLNSDRLVKNAKYYRS